MQRLATQARIQVVKALVEGCSVNSTVRMTGVAKTSILRLLADMGRVCLNHDDRSMRGLFVREIEADEIWGFNHCKAKTLPSAKAAPDAAGDVWTWYAVDRKSKAILSWIMGDRDESHAHAFMHDLASRIVGRPDLTTDGLGVYRDAVYDAFKGVVDYSQVHKTYQNIETAPGRSERRLPFTLVSTTGLARTPLSTARRPQWCLAWQTVLGPSRTWLACWKRTNSQRSGPSPTVAVHTAPGNLRDSVDTSTARRDRAAAARPAHNREVEGSNPSLATSIRVPGLRRS